MIERGILLNKLNEETDFGVFDMFADVIPEVKRKVLNAEKIYNQPHDQNRGEEVLDCRLEMDMTMMQIVLLIDELFDVDYDEYESFPKYHVDEEAANRLIQEHQRVQEKMEELTLTCKRNLSIEKLAQLRKDIAKFREDYTAMQKRTRRYLGRLVKMLAAVISELTAKYGVYGNNIMADF
uniref:BBS2_C domain-containing protein n=1 Tax=Caenorhabditis tropicalis TaxID=1561998 RepID=A0A1I7TBL4_9PELO